MAGGLIQLVAKGAEDIFMVDNPQISFFKTIFRKYSNFSMETIDIPVTGKHKFDSNLSVIIPKLGDLLGKIYFKVILPEIIPSGGTNIYNVINDILQKYHIIIDNVVPLNNVVDIIDEKINNYTISINFLTDIIYDLQNTSDVTDNNPITLYNKIATSISKYVITGTKDSNMLYVYNAVINASLQKIENDGTYDLTTIPDLSSYNVSLKNLQSNKSKGTTKIIMTTDEIVKAMYSNIYQYLFGNNPSELRFIQTVFTNAPNANSFGNVLLSSRLLDIFITLFTIQILGQVLISDFENALLSNSVEILLDTPFYIKYNLALSDPNTLYGFNDLDSYKFMEYYMNEKGPTVQDMLNKLSIPATDINTIKNTLTTIIYPDFRNILWADVIKNYLLNANTLLTLDQNNGNLVLVKRMDYTTSSGIGKGDILEYTDFFFGPNITPCIKLSQTSNTPVWPNLNNVPDPYWDNFTWQQVRKSIQDPSYFQVYPFIGFPGILQYPKIYDLTPLSNVSAGFYDLLYLNNYNIYLDSVLQTYYKNQHIALLSGEINESITIDSVFIDPIFTPISLQFLLGSFTTNPIYDVFRASAPGNNEFQNNYYKTFSMAPDVDPRMYRIRYLNGSVVVMFTYLQQKIDALISSTTLPLAEVVIINNTLTDIKEQISQILIEGLFPRKDKTLPYSITNDRTYTLFESILSNIPTGVAGFSDQVTVNNNVNFALSILPGFTLTTITLYSLYRLVYYPFVPNTPVDFSLIPEFISVNNFMKTDSVTGEEVFQIYIEKLNKMLVDNVFVSTTITFMNTLINNIQYLYTLHVQTCVNKLALVLGNIDTIFTNNPCDVQTIFSPSKYLNPIVDGKESYFICTQLDRPLLSTEIGATELWDSFFQACPETPDLPFAGFQPVPIPFLTYATFLEGLYYNLQNSFLYGSSIWYNINCHQKFNYNFLYGNDLLNKTNITKYVGSSSGTRVDNHTKNLVINYNNQVDIYNNYVISNTPSNFVPILKTKMIDNIDFTAFGTLPTDIVTNLYDYSFVRQIRYEIDSAPVTDYAYINVLLASISFYTYPDITPAIAQGFVDNILLGPKTEKQYIQRILDELTGRSNTITINDLVSYKTQLEQHTLEEYLNIRFDLELFAQNYSVYNWKKNLNDLTMFSPPPNNLFLSNTTDIKQYYIDTMMATNNQYLSIYVYPNVPTLYGFVLSNGNISGLTFSFGTDKIEGNYMETFFYYINNNFYTIGELWSYYYNYSTNYIISLMLPNQVDVLADNDRFWNAISPQNMYNNLTNIESDYPQGFRFTNKYFTFVIQNIFANISIIGLELSKNILVTDITSTHYPSIETIIKNFNIQLSKNIESRCSLQNDKKNIQNIIKLYEQNKVIPANFSWAKNIGHIIQEYATFYVGGEEYEKLTTDWFEINYNLNKNIGQERGYDIMTGNVSYLTQYDHKIKREYTLTIPCPFWFCKYSNYHFPIFLAHYQELLLKIKTRPFNQIAIFDKNTKFLNTLSKPIIPMPKYAIQAEFIYLDKDEREHMAQNKNEYLYEHVYNVASYTFSKDNINDKYVIPITLTINNNCKYIVWLCSTGRNINNNNITQYGWAPIDYETVTQSNVTPTNFNYTETHINNIIRRNVIKSTIIKFNGVERTTYGTKYYEYYQPYSYSKGLLPETGNMYSFGLSIGDMQPSGSVNLSKIDDLAMLFTIDPEFITLIKQCGEYFDLKIYFVTYNILRIFSGLCGRAFFE